MPTVRTLSDAVEARLARDLGAIHRALADAWRELVAAADGTPTPADRDRLTAYARRLLAAYAEANGPRIVKAQEVAVSVATATAKPDAADVWRAADPIEAGRFVGVVRGGDPVGRWLGGVGDAGVETIADLLLAQLGVADPSGLFAEALGEVGSRYLMGSRTAIHDAGRTATLAAGRANDDQVSGWVWTCQLTERSCLCCIGLHGQVMSLDDEFAPMHLGCGCRASLTLTGETPFDDTGDDWLAGRIAAGDLRNIPPKARDDLVNGRLELRDFITRGTDTRYGRDYHEASVRDARARAVADGRKPGPSGLSYPRTGRNVDIPADP
ncbi:hypothetical protein [Nocardioides sp.]|uniref:hypothetical protein n=1 Tax=Nocardioides sp. TaxID=35761 RepID=UPI002CA7425D|nr:hypothetical protein [Nocardioides sp.]HXH79533.1 hypothetical protein [Nocardioides sp.]